MKVICVFQKNLANDVTSWECEKRRRGECKAKIKLVESGNFLERINNHKHAPSERKCKISKVRANIQRRATETQDPAQIILGRELVGISKAAAINLPDLRHIRRNIRLQRQANQQLPITANREDVLELPFNINDLTPMKSFSYSTVDKVILIEFSSLEQTNVSNYFHSHKTSLVMQLSSFVPRYFFLDIHFSRTD